MNATVLILDDSLTVRMNLADAFATAGVNAIPCGSVDEAERLLVEQSVDAVVLDPDLADNGTMELLDRVRAAAPNAPLRVLMTGPVDDAGTSGQVVRADEYLESAYDASIVVQRTLDLIGSATHAGSPAQPALLLVGGSSRFDGALERALTGAGFTVVRTETGREAFERALSSPPSSLIVDDSLADMPAATLIRRLHFNPATRDVPCVLLAAPDSRYPGMRAFDTGADAVILPGNGIDDVVARMRALVDTGPVHDSRDADLVARPEPFKVLAVDDSATYLNAVAEALRHEGYEVALARSGEEALEALAAESFDCILLDLLMPGLGGQETCRRIKAAPGVRDIPLIMLTAMDDRDAMIEGLRSGADDYISKSSEFEVLTARVRSQVRRKLYEDEHRRMRDELLHKEREALEAQAARRVAETRAALADELQRANKELEAFSYSVSHDLRAPLRAIDGFSRMVLDDFGEGMDPKGREYLTRVRAAAQRMGELMDDLLNLSRVGRAEMKRAAVDFSRLAREVAATLRQQDDREVEVVVHDGLVVHGDARLLRVVLENLLGNAWKFTARVPHPRIEVGREQTDGGPVYFVRDNGAGFEAAYAEKLFRPFQRLHTEREFPGTGIGLATVYRIIDRHGGRIWAEGAVGAGARFSFVIPPPPEGGHP